MTRAPSASARGRCLPYLVRDVFPAEVCEVGGRVWSRARVFVTTERLVVWSMGRDRVPVKVVDAALAEPGVIEATMEAPMGPLEIATLTRGYLVNRGRGCRCQSALLALAPPAEWQGALA